MVKTFRWEQAGILMLLAGALLGLYAFRERPSTRSLPEVPQYVFVEITGEKVPNPGIYAFDRPPTLAAALRRAGAAPEGATAPHPLTSGSRVEVDGQGRVRVGRMAGARLLTLGLPLDINEATAEDLERLPGLGPELARRIVAHRREHGPFRRLEDLEQVKGLGSRSVARLQPYLTCAPGPDRETTLPGRR